MANAARLAKSAPIASRTFFDAPTETQQIRFDETFEADPETEKMLLDAMAQCDRGETIPLAQLIGELRSRE